MLVLALILALIVSVKHSDTERRSSILQRCHLMLTDAQFAKLMAGTRNGDQKAARQSVREYEPAIRSRLTAEELVIADRRGDGQSWEEISHELE